MIGTGFINNSLHSSPYTLLFLNGGEFTNNLMSNCSVKGTSDEGRYYNVAYNGCYFRIPVENVKFMIDMTYMYNQNLTPVAGWTEYVVDYSAYLQPAV